MSEKERKQKHPDIRFLPFQEEFMKEFLGKYSARVTELSLPPGTGKTHLAAEIIGRMADTMNLRMVLVLAPRALLEQFKYLLEGRVRGLRPILVDRRRYMDLEAAETNNASIWPDKSIVLISIDLAKRQEVRLALEGQKWDLVVVEESHMLRGQRMELFAGISTFELADKVLLLTSGPLMSEVTDVQRKEVKLEEVVDWNGIHIYPSEMRSIDYISYVRSSAEVALDEMINTFTKIISDIEKNDGILSALVIKAASSSNYALEETLRRLHDRWRPIRKLLAHGGPVDIAQYDDQSLMKELRRDDFGWLDTKLGENFKSKAFLGAYESISELLDTLEEIGIDSKFNALTAYIEEQLEMNDATHICVWTSFASTARYLQASLDVLDSPIYLITGSVSPIERALCIEQYTKGGGVLVTTDVTSEGVDMPFVDQCINYELPRNDMAMEMRWARFLRIGRKRSFKMIALEDERKNS